MIIVDYFLKEIKLFDILNMMFFLILKGNKFENKLIGSLFIEKNVK